MPKATRTPTTPRSAPASPPAAPPPLPSIIDLGRYAGAVTLNATRLYDHPGREGPDDGKGRDLGSDREKAVTDLILTYRAKTLADAAAQLFVGFRVVCDLENDDPEPSDLKGDVCALRRMVLSVLPIVATARGIDLAELGGDYIAEFADHEFPALER
jgi:hypothetical protein